jgi:hypothetical protein
MKRECDVWVCDYQDCLGFWLATSDEPPEKCSKCKRRRWHQKLSTVELIRNSVPERNTGLVERSSGLSKDEVREIAREVFREEWSLIPAEVDDIDPVHVPDLTGVPLSDKLAVARAALASVGHPAAAALSAQPFEPCPHQDPADEAGDIYGCALYLGHKGKCVRGAKVGDIW